VNGRREDARVAMSLSKGHSAENVALPLRSHTRVQWALIVITDGKAWGPDRYGYPTLEAAEAERDGLFSHLAGGGFYNGRRFMDAFVVTRNVTTFEPIETPWTPSDPQDEWPIARVTSPAEQDANGATT
jgi:hypothetical protein